MTRRDGRGGREIHGVLGAVAPDEAREPVGQAGGVRRDAAVRHVAALVVAGDELEGQGRPDALLHVGAPGALGGDVLVGEVAHGEVRVGRKTRDLAQHRVGRGPGTEVARDRQVHGRFGRPQPGRARRRPVLRRPGPSPRLQGLRRGTVGRTTWTGPDPQRRPAAPAQTYHGGWWPDQVRCANPGRPPGERCAGAGGGRAVRGGATAAGSPAPRRPRRAVGAARHARPRGRRTVATRG